MVNSPGMTMSPNSTVATNLTDASPSSVTRRCRTRAGGSRIGSRFRGVTHHSRTARYEAHLWDNGKQVYLGGFSQEAPAALAYDLAGVSHRGHDALLNGRWPLVEREMACRHTISKEEVIQKLRTQSKQMNKINRNPPFMKKADLLISQAINPHMEHIGLYRSQEDAARAYDRALIQKLGGVLSASFLNFPLYEYLGELTEEERQTAVAMSIIPEIESIEVSNSVPPSPIFNINTAGPDEEVPLDVDDEETDDEFDGEPGIRRKETKKSVLEMLCHAAGEDDDEVGVKRGSSETRAPKERSVRRSKRARQQTPEVEGEF